MLFKFIFIMWPIAGNYMSEKSLGYNHNDWPWDLEMFSAGMTSVWAVGLWKAEILSMVKEIFALWRLNTVYCYVHLVYNTSKFIDLKMR